LGAKNVSIALDTRMQITIAAVNPTIAAVARTIKKAAR